MVMADKMGIRYRGVGKRLPDFLLCALGEYIKRQRRRACPDG